MKGVFRSLFDRWPSLPFVLFGVFYAWLDLMVFSPLVFNGESAEVSAVRAEYLWSFFACSVLLNLGCVAFHDRVAPLLRKPWVPFASAALLIACTVLSCIVASGALSRHAVLLASVCGAVCQTYLTLLMVMRFLSLSGSRIFVNIALMRIVGAILYFMVSGLPRAVGVFVLVLLPAVLALSTHYSFDLNPASEKWDGLSAPAAREGGEAPVGRGDLARVLVAGFALVLVMNSVGFGSPRLWPYVEMMCVVLALGLVVVLVYASAGRTVILSYWYYAATISVILAFSIAAILPVSQPLGFIVCGSFRSVFDAFYLGFLIIVITRSRISPVRLTGLFYSVYLGAVLAGLVMATEVRASVSATAYSLGAAVFAVLTCAFLLAAFTPQDIQKLLGVTFSQGPQKRPSVPAAHAAAFDEAVLAELSLSSGLSAREREVLELLLAGYTVRMMSESLTISSNTTKTHMRNIYLKAGVRSREELLIRAHGIAGKDAGALGE